MNNQYIQANEAIKVEAKMKKYIALQVVINHLSVERVTVIDRLDDLAGNELLSNRGRDLVNREQELYTTQKVLCEMLVKEQWVQKTQAEQEADAPVVLPEPDAVLRVVIDGDTPSVISFNTLTNGEYGVFYANTVRALVAGVTAPAAQWLQPKDLEALQRFEETASDNQGHDIGKEAVARLAGFGCLQSHGFGVYSITDFGHFVLGDWERARELPFRTQAERDADQRAAIDAKAAQQGGAA